MLLISLFKLQSNYAITWIYEENDFRYHYMDFIYSTSNVEFNEIIDNVELQIFVHF